MPNEPVPPFRITWREWGNPDTIHHHMSESLDELYLEGMDKIKDENVREFFVEDAKGTQFFTYENTGGGYKASLRPIPKGEDHGASKPEPPAVA